MDKKGSPKEVVQEVATDYGPYIDALKKAGISPKELMADLGERGGLLERIESKRERAVREGSELDEAQKNGKTMNHTYRLFAPYVRASKLSSGISSVQRDVRSIVGVFQDAPAIENARCLPFTYRKILEMIKNEEIAAKVKGNLEAPFYRICIKTSDGHELEVDVSQKKSTMEINIRLQEGESWEQHLINAGVS